MHIETLAVDSLIPYARNSRTHSDAQIAQIAASVREYGFTNPVLIDADGGIVAGHGRVMAARALGMADVPCIRLAHLTDAQKRAYIIADNRLALNAGWDDSLLALELRDLADAGYDVGLTGFGLDEIDDMLRQVETVEMPALPSGEKSPFQQFTFTLHDSQAINVERALKDAKQAGPFIESPNANGNGNALARICEEWNQQRGNR